MLQDHVRT
jgi:histone-arginine methyltransferase CARM1